MKHTMRGPCPECPFRNDRDGYLTRGRAIEIAISVLKGQSFPCHKTTEHDDDEGEVVYTGKETQCAGAEIFAAHQGCSSQMARISDRIGETVSELDMDAPVFQRASELADAQGSAPAPNTSNGSTGEPCSVVNLNCTAPAGIGYGNGVVDCDDSSAEHWCPSCGEAVCDACSVDHSGERLCYFCDEGDCDEDGRSGR